jgi:CRP/FNR family transcriptional regulator, nitrogen oxide reductase regulator
VVQTADSLVLTEFKRECFIKNEPVLVQFYRGDPVASVEEFDCLKNSGLFDGLDQAALEAVYAARSEERHGPGEFYFFQGDPADSVYILAEGQVKLLQLTADGQQVILRMIAPFTLFGVVGTVKSASYPVTAEAIEASRAMRWSQAKLQELIIRYPQIAQNAMLMMAGHVQEFQDRVREMATERVERRVARALLRLVRAAGKKTVEGIEIAMPLSRQDLAEMSGTTLFTTSRILSDWERRGLVKARRERVIVVQPHGLVKIAEDLPGP